MLPGCEYGNVFPWGMIQMYWIIWLVISFIVSYVLGAVTLRRWENLKES